MSRNLPRAMRLGLALIVIPSLALLALESYVVLGNAPELRRNRELVVHTFEVIAGAQVLQRAVQDAERGQRGYLVTGDSSYLAPYRKSVDEIPWLLGKLRQQVADNPEHQGRMASLDLQVRYKLAELRESLHLAETQGIDAARRFVRNTTGRDTMDAINALIDGHIAAENFQLTDQLGRAAEDERRTALLSQVGGALALAIMTIGAFLGWLTLRRIATADAARRDSEARFHLFVEGVSDYAICMLDTEGAIVTWNTGAERINGYAASEIIGRNFEVFYTGEDRAAGIPRQALAIARGGKCEMEAWRVRKNGERFFASVVINAVHDTQGALVGFAKITRDSSERLAQQQALEQTKAELAQSQKMEALGQLSGGIAHDFNNVLHVINNAVAILRQRLPGAGPEIAKFLDMISRNAERAASLTQRLLAYSRTQPLDPSAVDPNALVTGMAALLEQTLGESVTIEIAPGEAVLPISVDANQLETALINLALNARDAMPRGGRLRIATSMETVAQASAGGPAEMPAGRYVQISVGDTGTGMTEDVLARAFDPFFTTKEPGQGTGLGLSQVFGFIKQSGGHVTIRSRPGSGTTVNLLLRPMDNVVQQEAPSAAAGTDVTAGSGTILVVEDNADIRLFTGNVLRDLGYHALDAHDARSAIEVLESRQVDVLFTDLGLPNGRNGLELAYEARRRWPELRVLFATGYADRNFIDRLDPDEEVLFKPFDEAALAGAMQKVLNERAAALNAAGARPSQ